jgi:hypothetical protein
MLDKCMPMRQKMYGTCRIPSARTGRTQIEGDIKQKEPVLTEKTTQDLNTRLKLTASMQTKSAQYTR